MDDQEEFLATDQFKVVIFQSVLSLLIAMAEYFGNFIFCLVAKLVAIDVRVDVSVFHGLLLEDIED